MYINSDNDRIFVNYFIQTNKNYNDNTKTFEIIITHSIRFDFSVKTRYIKQF